MIHVARLLGVLLGLAITIAATPPRTLTETVRMLRRLAVTLGALALVIVCTGCASSSLLVKDLVAAKARADAAVTAGLLPSADPLPVCLGALTAGIQALGPLGGPFAGLVDFGTDLYIIDQQTQAGSPQLETLCAPVAWKILRNGVRRMPGL